MADLPDVHWHRPPVGDEPVVLLLPGGTADSALPADEASFGRRRLSRFREPLLSGLPDVALGTLAYRVRGWNGRAADPARDVRAVLDALPGGSPVALVGHSMGGRAGLAVADHPRVRGVVGMAPWTPGGEPVGAVRGKTVVLAHGTWDRWVHTALSRAWAERAAGVAGRLARFEVRRDEHMMLLRPGRWHAFAVAGARTVLGREVDPVLAAALAEGRLDAPLPQLSV